MTREYMKMTMVIKAPLTWDRAHVKPVWKSKFSACLHETGTKITYLLIYSLACHCCFFYSALSSMSCSEAESVTETRLKCIRSRLHETGRCQTEMKIVIVSMITWDRYENHKSFDLLPLPASVVFLQVFVEHALFRSRERSWDSELHIYTANS